MPIGRAKQSRNTTHERCHLKNGSASEDQHGGKADRGKSPANASRRVICEMTKREKQRQQASEPRTCGQEMQDFGYDQRPAKISANGTDVTKVWLHRESGCG